ERDAGGANRGDAAVAQERQQYYDREYRADDHRVEHGAHGIPHELRLIVYRLDVHPSRHDALHAGHDARHAVGDLQRVTTGLARDVDECGGAAVATDEAHPVFGAHLHGRDITHVHGALQHHPGDIIDGVRLILLQHEVLPVILVDPADRLNAERLLNRVGQVDITQPERRQAGRLRNDLDLADLTALHFNAADTGHGCERGPDLIERDVVELSRVGA